MSKANFSSLFKASLHNYKLFFIYGNDLNVFDRIISFLSKKISSPLEIKSEKELLESSSLQLSLFENTQNKSLTLILNVSDRILTHIDQLEKGTFIFTSDKARAQSKLVTYFSNSSRSLAIAAYASPIMSSEFDFLVENLNLPAPFKDLLFKTYQNDYMGLLTALEKIKLYGDVPEATYASFLAPSSTIDDFQPLLYAFLLRNTKKVSEILSTVTSSNMIPFLRILLRSFLTLYELMPFKDRPASISWEGLKTPVFFKDQPIYQSALSHWTIEQVQSFLESLLKLESKVKYARLTLSQMSQELIGNVDSKSLN